MKKDYTYILPLDNSSIEQIKKIRKRFFELTGSIKYSNNWPIPHITLYYGNLLSKLELLEIKKLLNKLADKTNPFRINFEKKLSFEEIKRPWGSFNSVRLYASKNEKLKELSSAIMKIADKYEKPNTNFSNDKFYSTIVAYDIKKEGFNKFLANSQDLAVPKKSLVSGFSIFNSFIENGLPKSGLEERKFILKK